MFFSVLAAVFALAFFLQQFQWLAIGGANPNLALIFFGLLAVSRRPLFAKISAGSVLALVAWLIGGFWIFQILALAAIFFVFLFLRKFLTGNAFADFAVFAATGTFLFYMVSGLGGWQFLPWGAIIKETLYSLVLGLWLVFIFNDEKKD